MSGTRTATPPRDLAAPRGLRSGRRDAVATPGPATVDLLSPWVHDRIKVHRWRRRLGAAGLALVLLVAGAWTFQRLALAGAEADLRGEEAVGAQLGREIAALAPVQAYVGGVARRVGTVQEAMVTDVDLSRVLVELEKALPPGAGLESVSVDLPGPRADAGRVVAPDGTVADPTRGLEVTPCPGPDPFATLQVVGCLNLTGTATDREGVGALVAALDRSTWFEEPFVTTTTTSDGAPITFSGSVALAVKVFSRRYDDLGTRLGTVEPAPSQESP